MKHFISKLKYEAYTHTNKLWIETNDHKWYDSVNVFLWMNRIDKTFTAEIFKFLFVTELGSALLVSIFMHSRKKSIDRDGLNELKYIFYSQISNSAGR